MSSVNDFKTKIKAQFYNEVDSGTEETIRNLAKSLTTRSINSDIDIKSNYIESIDDHQSIFSNIEGVNPVLKDSSAPSYDARLDPNNERFSSAVWVKNLGKLMRADPDYYKPHTLDCVWKDLSASGTTSGIESQANIINAPIKFIHSFYRSIKPVKEENLFTILKPMEGSVNPGELLVVLGKPGSGCTTLLKSISNNTHGFNICKESVRSYSGFSPEEIKQHYRGEVIYNAEIDVHLPSLTVYQTLHTISRLKTPQNRVKGVDRESFAKHITEVTMATYGLSHTRDTRIGNDLIRGVSGGERKRVSIAEVAICGAKFQCWDNATRGLDSATALEVIRAFKTNSTMFGYGSALAIYHCSEDAFSLFDKVCVLDQGYQLYFGPRNGAKRYFENMGYICPDRQTTADFLTAITSPSERIINEEFLKKGIKIPQTPKDMNEYWKQSTDYRNLMHEINNKLLSNTELSRRTIKEAHIAKQSKSTRNSSPYTVNYFLQIKYLLARQFWIIKNNPSIDIFRIFGNVVMALILGSMFYKIMLHDNTNTFYFRGAAMFSAVLFNAFSCLLEVFTLYQVRPIVEKHRLYSLYHPSADALASVISQLPTKLAIAICFNTIFYFLVNFRRDVGAFFFYMLINLVTIFSMSYIYRTFGSVTKTLSQAMFPASMLLLGMAMFTGFAIPSTKMLSWSIWIWYINPLAYLFESLMINEFHDRKFTCSTFIPMGSYYANSTGTERICMARGAIAGQEYVLGDEYLKNNFAYVYGHKWRNFGIGMAFVVFFFFTYLLACEYGHSTKQRGEMLVFPSHIVRKMKKLNKSISRDENTTKDLETGACDSSITDITLLEDSDDSEEEKYDTIDLTQSVSTLHWRNLCYDIKINKETRKILQNVDGWVKPGTLTALMGCSGAGKTTLLDCLAERVTVGVISGDVFVDSKPRDGSFPKSIGYCQQQDLHLETSTVREALRFSAYLRQPYAVSIKEKNMYVEKVINMLDMETFADAVVGILGEGLNVEQRKRLSIGVELAAKPKLLVFLDEPTSGLDSQTAWSICQLMKKLAYHGQAILCTIHQPSAVLMEIFDRLLLLEKGGKTVYFGDLGYGCQNMINYFESNGSQKCPVGTNPAEWMLDVIGASPGCRTNKNHHEIWRNSEEYQSVQAELDLLEGKSNRQIQMESETSNSKTEFETSIWYQCVIVSKRLLEQYWRSPQYLWSKFALTIFTMLFIGFTFYNTGNSLQGLQNQTLAIFMFTVIFNPLLQQYLPNIVQQRNLYEIRERPSRTFSWKAFMVSQILIELIWNFVAGTVAFVIFYYTIGFYHNASVAHQLYERGALFWMCCTAYFVYVGSMGLLSICVIEVLDNAAYASSLLFTMCLSFCGVFTTKTAMPTFWVFMYRLSPLTYLLEVLLAVGVGNVSIQCDENEFLKFTPPTGKTCGDYMAPWFFVLGTGYLEDNNATDICSLCEITRTNDYLRSVDSEYSARWRNYGIFICYIFFNYAAATLLYYLFRVPKKSAKIKKTV